jgi:hypothetical protein
MWADVVHYELLDVIASAEAIPPNRGDGFSAKSSRNDMFLISHTYQKTSVCAP